MPRRLMLHAIEDARRRGVEAVSLSVEADNPAVRLYESLGFSPARDATAGTMLLEL